MDDLLEEMSRLADEAGDWRDHLPYSAAAGFLEDAGYQEQYGAHVDECRYCQQLVEALHPREDALADLLAQIGRTPHRAKASVNVDDALTDAIWYLDSIDDELMANSQNLRHGTRRKLAFVHRCVDMAIKAVKDPASSVLTPWTATVALSLDTSPNLHVDERKDDRLNDTVEGVASNLLASGYRVAHAGDSRSRRVSQSIWRLASPFGYRRRLPTQPNQDVTLAPKWEFGVSVYCAWPIHIGDPIKEIKEVEEYEATFGQQGIVKWLSPEGEIRPLSHFAARSCRHEPDASLVDDGLGALRNAIDHESSARIVVGGGAIVGHEAMTSVAQDALLSLKKQHPLYVLGGLGGCAGHIAAALHLTDTQPAMPGTLDSKGAFDAFIGSEHLHNGLDASENRTLAGTTVVEEATKLVLRGLDRIAGQQRYRL